MQSLMNRAREKNGHVQSKHFDTFFNQINTETPTTVTKNGVEPLFGQEADLIDSLIELAAHNERDAETLLDA